MFLKAEKAIVAQPQVIPHPVLNFIPIIARRRLQYPVSVYRHLLCVNRHGQNSSVFYCIKSPINSLVIGLIW